MKKELQPYWTVTFSTSLGWFALLGEKNQVKELTFGHSSAKEAKNALTPDLVAKSRSVPQRMPLVRRLQAYAEGAVRDDFHDVRLDLGRLSDFQHRVLDLCRKIPLGTTLTYGQLAAQAGSARAARAVGNCMAGNKIPIIIPCHRVVPAGGGLGSYSACGGSGMKKRLLLLENSLKK
jgi:methylated-DNA-[protein]-cysteine S-methyltransferase